MKRKAIQISLLHALAVKSGNRLLQNHVFQYLDQSDLRALHLAAPALGRFLLGYKVGKSKVSFWADRVKLPPTIFTRTTFVSTHYDESAWSHESGRMQNIEAEVKTGRCTRIFNAAACSTTVAAAYQVAITTSLRFWNDGNLDQFHDVHDAHEHLTDMKFYDGFLYTACDKGLLKIWDRFNLPVGCINLQGLPIRRFQLDETRIFIVTENHLFIYSRDHDKKLHDFKIPYEGTVTDMLLVNEKTVAILINDALIEVDITTETITQTLYLPEHSKAIHNTATHYFIQYNFQILRILRSDWILSDQPYLTVPGIIQMNIHGDFLHVIYDSNHMNIYALHDDQPLAQVVLQQDDEDPFKRPGPIEKAVIQGNKLITFTKRGVRLVFEGQSVTLPIPLIRALNEKLTALARPDSHDTPKADSTIHRYIDYYGHSEALTDPHRIGKQLTRAYPETAWIGLKKTFFPDKFQTSPEWLDLIEKLQQLSKTRTRHKRSLFVLAHREREEAFQRALGKITSPEELQQLVTSQLDRYRKQQTRIPENLINDPECQDKLGRNMHFTAYGLGGYYHFLKQCKKELVEFQDSMNGPSGSDSHLTPTTLSR